MLIFLAIAYVFALICLGADALATDKGIKAGVALEGNAIVRTLSGTDKPSFEQIMAIEVGVIRTPLILFGIVTAMHGLNPLAYLAGIALVVAGVKNIQGARKWAWMFAHEGQKLPVMETVWQKIVGFWG